MFSLFIGVKTTALPINQQGLQISESLYLVYTTDVDSSSAGFHNVGQNSFSKCIKVSVIYIKLYLHSLNCWATQ